MIAWEHEEVVYSADHVADELVPSKRQDLYFRGEVLYLDVPSPYTGVVYTSGFGRRVEGKTENPVFGAMEIGTVVEPGVTRLGDAAFAVERLSVEGGRLVMVAKVMDTTKGHILRDIILASRPEGISPLRSWAVPYHRCSVLVMADAVHKRDDLGFEYVRDGRIGNYLVTRDLDYPVYPALKPQEAKEPESLESDTEMLVGTMKAAGANVTAESVDNWTGAQRDEALDWAATRLVDSSEHLPKPDHVAEAEKQSGNDDEDEEKEEA